MNTLTKANMQEILDTTARFRRVAYNAAAGVERIWPKLKFWDTHETVINRMEADFAAHSYELGLSIGG